MFNIGYCYLQLDSIDKAYKHFGMAIDVNPEYAEAYYNKGLCAVAKDDMMDAKYNFEQALSLKPDFKAAKTQLDKLK
jgi:tetratricopeptide (TPR) repeat protein